MEWDMPSSGYACVVSLFASTHGVAIAFSDWCPSIHRRSWCIELLLCKCSSTSYGMMTRPEVWSQFMSTGRRSVSELFLTAVMKEQVSIKFCVKLGKMPSQT
jgi:hypothetical protein